MRIHGLRASATARSEKQKARRVVAAAGQRAGLTCARRREKVTLGRDARELVGLVADFCGDLRQGGRVLPAVMSTEQQFQATGQQDPHVSPRAAAITAVRCGKRPGKGSVRFLAAGRLSGPLAQNLRPLTTCAFLGFLQSTSGRRQCKGDGA